MGPTDVYLGCGPTIVPPPMPTARKSLAVSLLNIYETLGISVPTVLDAILGRVTKETCDARLAAWGKKIVAHARMEVTVVGRENMAEGATYLLMSNHQSHYDIPVLFYVVGANLRMLGKVELFKIPIFGEAAHQAGFIAVDRSNRTQAMKSLQVAKDTIAHGVHVWIAPEGTRSRTGDLLPFKKGGFSLALEAGLPVLPITIQGTKNALHANDIRSVRDAKVRVTISPPLEARDYAAGDLKTRRAALMADVRRAIESGL
jgi:1-acyl-sn-glycerol-3-phosphate acyltransferase